MLNRKKIIKGICFVFIFILLFCFFQKLLQVKWIKGDNENPASTSSWTEFRTLEKNSLDVLFLGTSHAYSAIDPMYIYDKTGITSYVFGGPGLRIDLTYMVLEDALRTQNPSVVFLDMSAIQFDFQQTEAKCHKVSDQLPISISKIEYALQNGNEELKPLDVLFPFFRYHSRWAELTSDDFKYVSGDLEESFIRGHYITFQTKATKFHFYEEAEYRLDERNRKYLTRMKQLCDENDIELIFFKIPTPRWYESQSEGAAQLGELLDVTYLELFYQTDEMGLDVSTDFRDKADHMNQAGTEKLCTYLARYLTEHYDFEDKRLTNQRWNEDLVKYKELVRKLEEKSRQQ